MRRSTTASRDRTSTGVDNNRSHTLDRPRGHPGIHLTHVEAVYSGAVEVDASQSHEVVSVVFIAHNVARATLPEKRSPALRLAAFPGRRPVSGRRSQESACVRATEGPCNLPKGTACIFWAGNPSKSRQALILGALSAGRTIQRATRYPAKLVGGVPRIDGRSQWFKNRIPYPNRR